MDLTMFRGLYKEMPVALQNWVIHDRNHDWKILNCPFYNESDELK
jgi:hypothetical protein